MQPTTEILKGTPGMIDFEDQAVVVIGAGRGLGRLYAMEMARRGAMVIVNDIGVTYEGADPDPAVVDAVVEEIRSAGGIAVSSHDSVATPEGGAAIVSAALEEFGRIDAIVGNAGVGSWQRLRISPLSSGAS
jgi:NAD(P)-dependent dehydrogenase (short-subunit alcohol dehydrogenase family)